MMRLMSHNFVDGGKIPSKYTCDSEGVNPHLSWEGAPEGTKSFAVTCLDPDATIGEFAHWLIVNIPPTVREIPEVSSAPAGADEIANDSGRPGYHGPCPPRGEHRYIFTIYALGIEHVEGLNRETFVAEVKEHMLDSATLVGLYQRVTQ